MGMSAFVAKWVSVSIDCLELAAGVFLYVWAPLCFYMLVLLSYHFPQI